MSGTASIYSIANEDRVRAEAAAWARFSAAKAGSDFYSGWLAILCSQIERVSGGLLLLGPDAEGSYSPVAMWPDASRDLQYLGAVAERTLVERRGLVIAADGASAPARDQNAIVGYPIEVSGQLHGVVVLDVAPGPDRELQRAMRLLHWSSAWLVDHFRQREIEERDARLGRMALAMDLVATAVQERRLAASAFAVVNELAGKMRCERVSIGFERGGAIVVTAISHTAVFDGKMGLVRRIGDAMDEVLDLDTALVYPPSDDTELGAIAHAELAREYKAVAVCSVPLLADGQSIGVLTLERSSGPPFDAAAIEFCKTAGTLLGSVLALKEENERGTWQRLRTGVHAKAEALFGPGHPGAKLVATVMLGIILTLAVVSSTHRVSARAFLEGAVQRAAVAPFEGHIVQSMVRAGDTVKAGQALARLDDRELKLNRVRYSSERQQLLRKHQQALAVQDRSAMVISTAQINAIDAQIALLDDKLARATLVAPFDGIVVSGDLSQLLGTPVEQGKVLFQIAPLDAYRVMLEVDERDIADIAVGQSGDLALSGLPDRMLNFSVQQVTPVATAQDGRNYFRVEAHMNSTPERLRPGMEGIGKVAVGEARLIWIWTHSLGDWLKTWAWKQLP